MFDDGESTGTLTMPRKKRDDQTVKIDRGIVERAGIVAARRKDAEGKPLSVAEYLSELLRGLVDRDYRETVRQLNAEIGDSPAEIKRRK